MASPTQDLDVFVREALAQGQARDAIAAALAEAGWPAEQVRNALDAYATVAFPVPVPISAVAVTSRQRGRTTRRARAAVPQHATPTSTR